MRKAGLDRFAMDDHSDDSEEEQRPRRGINPFAKGGSKGPGPDMDMDFDMAFKGKDMMSHFESESKYIYPMKFILLYPSDSEKLKQSQQQKK
jgi:hypothetical protein